MVNDHDAATNVESAHVPDRTEGRIAKVIFGPLTGLCGRVIYQRGLELCLDTRLGFFDPSRVYVTIDQIKWID